MSTKGIRGAITVKENTKNALEEATLKLLNEMILKNKISTEKISHVIFSVTSDLNADFPAKFARLNLNWTNVPMMCFNEIDVPESLKKCLRVLIVVNCNDDFIPEFIYLDGAANLRK
ncbi:chorismate mutase [bacterium]|nr:chorismate mutase [bacterium]